MPSNDPFNFPLKLNSNRNSAKGTRTGHSKRDKQEIQTIVRKQNAVTAELQGFP